MPSTVAEFFSSTGAIEMFCELAHQGARFKHLNNVLEISHTTLTRRLREAEELDLITSEAVDGERRRTHKYVPTVVGHQIVFHLHEQGVVERYQLCKETRRRYQEKADQICEQLETNPRDVYYGPDDSPEKYQRIEEEIEALKETGRWGFVDDE